MIYAPPIAITQVVLKKKIQGWQVCFWFVERYSNVSLTYLLQYAHSTVGQ